MGSRQTHWHRSEEPMVIYSARRLALLVGLGVPAWRATKQCSVWTSCASKEE